MTSRQPFLQHNKYYVTQLAHALLSKCHLKASLSVVPVRCLSFTTICQSFYGSMTFPAEVCSFFSFWPTRFKLFIWYILQWRNGPITVGSLLTQWKQHSSTLQSNLCSKSNQNWTVSLSNILHLVNLQFGWFFFPLEYLICSFFFSAQSYSNAVGHKNFR